ncbi:Rha family transcriptional regulator [Bartonella rattaustraliani]|uniref:Rha family transcriptional regulator n=1 Tax=Bartonella rattaustraliani TaxID=481139 RepID=UPI0003116369|nr:Rha family transcriptional regulator [Bartonella rattaustraliani]
MHNRLMSTKDNHFNKQSIQTMSSVEIAELCGKRHSHVMRDIKKMLEEINEPKFGLVDFSGTYIDAKRETRPCYNLPERECLILVSGYSIGSLDKMIDHWEELKNQVTTQQFDLLYRPAKFSHC